MSACAGHAGFREIADMPAFGDMDLRLDDIDAGDDLGDRMLDLNARIDLDEIEFAGIDIHQEFDRAGIAIICRAADRQRRVAECLAVGIAQIRRRGALDHLLVAALDRAVALEQMHEIAMGIAQQLDLDMAGAAHEFFQIHLVIAEGGFRLALGGSDGFEQRVLALDRPHAAPAAAPAGLQHHRIADLRRPGA